MTFEAVKIFRVDFGVLPGKLTKLFFFFSFTSAGIVGLGNCFPHDLLETLEGEALLRIQGLAFL